MQHKIGKLVIVRHGESEWNKVNLFTGKKDVHLTSQGFKTSEAFGVLIKDIEIHKVFASMQARSIETEVCMMSGKGNCCTENVCYSSALNERDYGDYTGQNKVATEQQMGKEEVDALRRSWDYPIPHGETLKMVYERVVPFFTQEILPVLQSGENVLIVSHGNTIRALIKYIENISDKDIEKVEMLFNELFIYEVNKEGHVVQKETRIVGDPKHTLQSSKVRSFSQIIATIGPASDSPEILEEMIKAGVDMARLNFSWQSTQEHLKRIKIIREVAKKANMHVLIMADLPGPRIQNKDGHTYTVQTLHALTEKDKELIRFSVENKLDYIAVSFVGNDGDIVDCRNEIHTWGGKQKIIAKIERKKALENIDTIIEVADAIMIARGDLGNEVALEKLPFIQEEIIKKCKNAGKPVITATQMLFSMKDNPSPTRAEATDVVQAVLEGSDAVMLSEETSIGKYPIRAVYVMEHLALEAESHLENPIFNHL